MCKKAFNQKVEPTFKYEVHKNALVHCNLLVPLPLLGHTCHRASLPFGVQ